jgi:hypothetical protein
MFMSERTVSLVQGELTVVKMCSSVNQKWEKKQQLNDANPLIFNITHYSLWDMVILVVLHYIHIDSHSRVIAFEPHDFSFPSSFSKEFDGFHVAFGCQVIHYFIIYIVPATVHTTNRTTTYLVHKESNRGGGSFFNFLFLLHTFL